MNSAPQRVLVVEDEPKLAALLADYLRQSGYVTEVIGDGLAVVPWLRANKADLMLLDVLLPGRDGLDILRETRSFSALPIVMVTARVEEIDRLLGLELGADDYICKPFSPREVVARVKAVLRRGKPAEAEALQTFLRLDEERFEAFVAGNPLKLTRTEFNLLQRLSAMPGRVYSRAQLLDAIYDDHRVVSDRTVDSHIKNLRRKITEAAPDRDPIQSVYGVGYKFEL